MINEIKNKRILIKTYLVESGLWYLAKSLGDALSKNNEVLYAPKSKYKEHDHGFFGRYYPEANDKDLLSGIPHLELTNRRKVEPQLLKVIAERDIDIIISFETLMRHGQWVPNVKSKTNVKIIDVPMPEWTGDRFVKNYSYNIFDEIWCLTDASYKVFEKYKNKKRVSWDYVDRDGIVSLYDKSHCVIIPSSREGLGLGFYEAKAMGCDLITTNAAPMNKHSDYLCEVISYNKNESPVPFAMINTDDLVDQLIKYNEDFNMSKNETKEIN